MQNLMRHPPPPPGYAITVFTQSEPSYAHGQCILKRRRFYLLYVHINNYS